MIVSTRSPSQLSSPRVMNAPMKRATIMAGISAENPNSRTKRLAKSPLPSPRPFIWIEKYSRATIIASTIMTMKFSPSSQGVAPAVGLSGSAPEIAMKVANTATSAAIMKSPSKRAQLAFVACWLSVFDNSTLLYRGHPGPVAFATRLSVASATVVH